ncbi:MAG: sporulation protein YunB [Lachnospirales bacterium]
MFSIKFKIITISLTIFVIISFSYNKFVLPIIVDITQKYAVTTVNKEISLAYKNFVSENNLTQQDFTSSYMNNQTEYVNTNTITVNNMCNELGEIISERLNNIEDKKVKIPIGTFLNSPILSNSGPNINITLNQMGQTKIDYNSSFKSCGVNQVNYKLWLDVESEVAIVTPALCKNLIIKRKIVIVDMVYNGGVPQGYVNVVK